MSRFSHQVEPPRGSLARAAALACALACAASLGCGSSEPDARELADAIAPHEEEMLHFVRWTRLALRTTSRDRSRTSEALFAPVREHDRFRSVVVRREGRTPFLASEPAGREVPELPFQSVRSPHFGTLEVARAAPPGETLWARVDAGEGIEITFELAGSEAAAPDQREQ